MLAIPTSVASANGARTRLVPLSESAMGRSVATAQTLIVERKEHLFCDGDDATHIYKVEAGHVCIYRILGDGRRQVIDFAFPGDFIGLGAKGQHTTSAQATERTRLRCLPVSELREIINAHPRLGMDLYEMMSSKLAGARNLLVSVCQRSAQERVAGFLLALSRRKVHRGEDASCIVLPMTRTDIADYLGLTIETVSRTLSKMGKARVIDIEQNIIITINDSKALADMAEGGR